MDGRVALRSLKLAGLSENPSDRFIAATALVNGATLVTADEQLLAWNGTLAHHEWSVRSTCLALAVQGVNCAKERHRLNP